MTSPESTDVFDSLNDQRSEGEVTDIASEISDEETPEMDELNQISGAIDEPNGGDISTVEEMPYPMPKRRVLPPKLLETRTPRIRKAPERFGDKDTWEKIYGNQSGTAKPSPNEDPMTPEMGEKEQQCPNLSTPTTGVTYTEILNEAPDVIVDDASDASLPPANQTAPEHTRKDATGEYHNLEKDHDELSDSHDETGNPKSDQGDEIPQNPGKMTGDGTKRQSRADSPELSALDFAKILKDKEEELRNAKRLLENKESELSSLKRCKPNSTQEPSVDLDDTPPKELDSSQVALRAIQTLLEESSERRSKTGMKDSQWTSDRKYITDHWPVFKKHSDIIERVVGLSDWEAQVKNVLSTMHEMWRSEWDDMFSECKNIAIRRQKITSSRAVLLFPEDPDKTGMENKVRRVFADMLVHKQSADWFKTLSRREKDSPARLLWTVVSQGLVTTAHEMMELSNALGRQWPQIRSSEDLEEQIRRSEEAIECAMWYPSAIIPGMSERILLLDKATMSLGEVDKDIGTSYNVLTENMDFDLSQSDSSKLKYYDAIVALVRKRSERKRYLGIQSECSLVSLPAVAVDKPKSKKKSNKNKGKGSKEEATPAKSTPAPPQVGRSNPTQTQNTKPDQNHMCGTWHRWDFCPYMDRCRMKKSHTTSNKPPEAGCMCIKMLLGEKCDDAKCERKHCPIGAEHFKKSKSGENLNRVKSRPDFDMNSLKNALYTIINTGKPTEPKRCFNCGGENHKQASCTQPKLTCALCGGQHKTSYCVEHAAWYMKEFPPLRKDFR